jgi:hypothetical protein
MRFQQLTADTLNTVINTQYISNGGRRPMANVMEKHSISYGDVIEDEATRESSRSGLPMFGNTFPK